MGTTKFSLVTTRGKYIENKNPDNNERNRKISQYVVANYPIESDYIHISTVQNEDPRAKNISSKFQLNRTTN